jgi:DNA invertase Pin-like site-specific DNA recombinase
MADAIRVLGIKRLSRMTDSTTSPERQGGVVTTWSSQHGATIVDFATDLGVSGAKDPFERDGLGPWLTDSPPKPWNTLVAWRLDRVSRSALDTLRLLEWLEVRGKRLVTVSDGIDTSTAMGRLFVQIAGVFAQLERETIRERVLAGRAALRAAGRWGGEPVPYGYRPVQADGGGYRLDKHPETVGTVVAVFDRYLSGKGAEEIARWLTDEGVLSPAVRARLDRGEYVVATPWLGATVLKMLANRSYLGWTVHEGVADPDVPKGPEIITPSVFERVQAEMKKRSRAKTRNPGSSSAPLSGVVLCWECLEPLWHRAQRFEAGQNRMKEARTYRYYYCKTKGHTKQVRADDLEDWAEKSFLRAFANTPVIERVETPASDVEDELSAVQIALNGVAAALASARSQGARTALLDQLAALDDKRAELEAVPAEPARVDLVESGRTWAEELDGLDDEGRRDLWMRTGFRFAVQSTDAGFTLAIRPPE